MDDEDFYNRFMRDLANIVENRNYNRQPGKAFVFWLAKNYFHIEDEDECEARISDGFNDEGIDGIFIDEEEGFVYIVNASTVTDFKRINGNIPESDIKNLFAGYELITFGDYRGKVNPILEDLAKEYHQMLNTGEFSVKLMFFSLTKPPVSKKYVKEFCGKHASVEVDFIDFDATKAIYEHYLVYREPPPRKVTIEVIGKILQSTTEPQALVFTISGKTLANLFFTYGTRLFQRNVRYFLTARAKSINFYIQQTASSEDSQRFWYYNNGVTAVCEKFKVAPNEQVVSVEKMQIINGAQTTYSLYKAYQEKKLKDDVRVLFKIMESGEEEFIDNVTLYTNSQNPVNLRDLASRDTVQTKIQTQLLTYKYFYEIKRGEFQALYETVEMKKKLLGDEWKDKIISNERAAQTYLAFFVDRPAQAKASKRRIFVKGSDGFYDSIFCKNLNEEELLMTYKLWCYIEEETKKYRDKYNQAKEMEEKERNAVYSYGFLLYSDFFVLNLFKDFLQRDGYKFGAKGSLDIVKLIDENSPIIQGIYKQIVKLLHEYILIKKNEDETYYNAKFFKSEANMSLIRDFLRKDKELTFIKQL
jgi:hypothetical protein